MWRGDQNCDDGLFGNARSIPRQLSLFPYRVGLIGCLTCWRCYSGNKESKNEQVTLHVGLV
jgi:hypothetical protein